MKNQLLSLIMAVLTLVISPWAVSEEIIDDGDPIRGREIAIQADRVNVGWEDMVAQVKMILRNKAGDESTRSIVVRVLEIVGGGDKSVVAFNSPANIRGTALLTHAHTLNSDDQWQYFPALKRVKRISSENKSGPFMGSEFAYEDLSSWEVDKYDYFLLGEEIIDDKDTFKLRMKPKYSSSGYTYLITWLDKLTYAPIKVDYFDRKGSLLKTQIFNDYTLYLDRYWRAGVMTMENHQTGKSTVLEWSDYKFQNNFSQLAFEKGSLDRYK